MIKKGRKAERKEKMTKGKERASISGRHAIGNVHYRATRKKPKSTLPESKFLNVEENAEILKSIEKRSRILPCSKM